MEKQVLDPFEPEKSGENSGQIDASFQCCKVGPSSLPNFDGTSSE